jgi:hypothetical protein
LIPGFDGALFTLKWRDALWADFVEKLGDSAGGDIEGGNWEKFVLSRTAPTHPEGLFGTNQ